MISAEVTEPPTVPRMNNGAQDMAATSIFSHKLKILLFSKCLPRQNSVIETCAKHIIHDSYEQEYKKNVHHIPKNRVNPPTNF